MSISIPHPLMIMNNFTYNLLNSQQHVKKLVCYLCSIYPLDIYQFENGERVVNLLQTPADRSNPNKFVLKAMDRRFQT